MGLIGDIPGFGWTDALHGIPLAIFFIITFLVILFAGVALRSLVVALGLGKIAKQIRNQGKHATVLPATIFKGKELYRHLWSEYEETLHTLKRKDGVTELRATLPAEAFFTKETLVDNRIFVWNDFFRHLPGILTGLGIIGTFAGLISGLEAFSTPLADPNIATTGQIDPANASQNLGQLLEGVKEAFHLSAYAITCAIIVTFLEKSLLTWGYKNVEKITHAIDALYDAGAGEEYLARLVEADEANTAQTAQLKDSLVNDLRTLLGELTERQIEAQQASSLHLGQTISGSLSEVKTSLTDLHSTFAGKASTDTDNIKGALDSLMAAFIERINTTLGDQMQAIQSSMQQSTHTMQQVEQSLNGLVNNIARTTSGMMEEVMAKMEDTMQKAASNQEQMTRQMGEFVNQLRTQMENQQTASHETMQKMLEELLQAMQNGQAESHTALDRNLASITNHQEAQHNRLTTSIEDLLNQIGNAVTMMQSNVTELRRTTTDAISGMNSGADRMKVAADHFTTAGQSVSGILEKATPMATQMASSSNTLGQASQQLANGLTQYEKTRIETARHIETLQQLLDAARQETGIKKELINDIQRVADTLRQTENQSIEYLEKVNQVLIQSFQDFGNAMKHQVSQSITQTDTHLSSGVNQLTGVIVELGTQLQKMRSRG